jgi:hypothetical protein
VICRSGWNAGGQVTHIVTDIDDLLGLLEPRPEPAVTITMPTSRIDPWRSGDELRLRHLVARAIEMLDSFTTPTVEAVAAGLIELSATLDFEHLLDGLLITVDPKFAQLSLLPTALPEEVCVGDRFALGRSLVALARLERCTIIISEEDSLHRVDVTGGHIELADPVRIHRSEDLPVATGRGLRSGAVLEERRSAMSDGIGHLLHLAPARGPLVAVAIGPDLDIVDAAMGDRAFAVIAHHRLGEDAGRIESIAELALTTLSPHRAAERARALKRLDDARSRHRVVAAGDEAHEISVENGALEYLFVPEDADPWLACAVARSGGALTPLSPSDLPAGDPGSVITRY